jgi:hypothetical protein
MKYSNKVYSNPREEEKHDEHLFLTINKIDKFLRDPVCAA